MALGRVRSTAWPLTSSGVSFPGQETPGGAGNTLRQGSWGAWVTAPRSRFLSFAREDAVGRGCAGCVDGKTPGGQASIHVFAVINRTRLCLQVFLIECLAFSVRKK